MSLRYALKRFAVVSIAVLGLATLGGCVTTPRFPEREGLSVAHLSRHIECEVYDAAVQFQRLVNKEWVAAVILTLQVDEDANLAPSITHVLPLAIPSTSFMFGYGAKLDTSSQRIYTENLTIKIKPLVAAVEKNNFCSNEKRIDIDLAGDLGITEIVRMGFSTSRGTTYSPGLGVEGGKDKSAFGESIQFIVTKNVNGVGPTWTLTHFKGPGGLLNASRTTTNKLIISFAPGAGDTEYRRGGGGGGAVGAAAAANAAMNNNLLLLQQSLPSNIARQIQQLQ